MAVSRDHIGEDGENVVAYAVKFVITEEVCHVETPAGVCLENWGLSLEDRVVVAVSDHGCSAETDVARNRMEEENTLNIKEIDAQCNIAVMLEHWWRQRDSGKSDNVGGSMGLGGRALQKRNIFAINNKGTGGVSWCNGAVMDQVVS